MRLRPVSWEMKGSMYSALTSDENWGQPFRGHKSEPRLLRQVPHNPSRELPQEKLLTGPLGLYGRCAEPGTVGM